MKMRMKETALIYGGEWVGKTVDKLIDYGVPMAYRSVTKVGLAALLPLLTVFMPTRARRKNLETIVLLTGGFLATKA